MKKTSRIVKQLYISPLTEVFGIEVEGNLLAASPGVRPGGGGNTNDNPTTPNQGGNGVTVIDLVEEDGGDDDILVGN